MFLIFASFVYLVSRFYHLFSLPIFIDEALYLRMARDLLFRGEIWVSFSDGKEPLFFWILAIGEKFFADPLIAGRVLGVLIGWGTVFVLYFIGKELFNQKVARISVVFYLFSPFIYFYNRLALLDNFLVLLFCLYVLFLIRKQALLAGFFLGLALITKTYAVLFILVLILIRRESLGFYLKVAIFALAVFAPIFFAPGYQNIFLKNQTVFLTGNFPLVSNLKMSFKDWWLIYFGSVSFLTSLGIGLWTLLRRNYPGNFLFLLMIGFWIVESAVAKIFFPRYLLFMAIPLFLLVGWFSSRRFTAVLLAIFLLQPIFLTSQLIFLPEKANLPEVERWQYFTGWPAGYGSGELIKSLKNLSKIKPITVVTEDFGVGEIIKLNFYGDKRVQIETFKDIGQKIKGDYLVLNFYQDLPKNWQFYEIASFCKVECKEKIKLYAAKQ